MGTVYVTPIDTLSTAAAAVRRANRRLAAGHTAPRAAAPTRTPPRAAAPAVPAPRPITREKAPMPSTRIDMQGIYRRLNEPHRRAVGAAPAGGDAGERSPSLRPGLDVTDVYRRLNRALAGEMDQEAQGAPRTGLTFDQVHVAMHAHHVREVAGEPAAARPQSSSAEIYAKLNKALGWPAVA